MGFEVRLYSQARLEPVAIRFFRELHEAVRDVNGALGREGLYCGTIHLPGSMFQCYYWNGQKVLQINQPWYLSETQAARLYIVNGRIKGLPEEFQRELDGRQGMGRILRALVIIALLALPSTAGTPDGISYAITTQMRAEEPRGWAGRKVHVISWREVRKIYTAEMLRGE